MQYITLTDYLLLPFYLVIIYFLAFVIRHFYYPKGHIYRKYFIPALTIKIGGAITIALIYQYYYGSGDTFEFFLHAKIINNTWDVYSGTWCRLIIHSADDQNLNDLLAVSKMYWYDDISSYTVASLGAIIGLFCFTKYLIISLMIAAISFTGLWALFVTYADQYKNAVTPIAIATLFMPSVVIWGSGLFKDTFCITAIGWISYSFYILLEKGKLKLHLILLAGISMFLLFLIKKYILVSFVPLLLFKIALIYKQRLMKHPKLRWVAFLTLPLISILCIYCYRTLNRELITFTVDNIVSTIITQKDYLLRISIEQQGSAYDLGEIEPTLNGILKKTLPAINVALFRPYIWEAHSAIVFFTSLEACVLLFFTLKVIFNKSFIQNIRATYRSPNLLFFITFSLVFAFFTGISTFNFGSLSRYRIPCIPFYMLFLMVMSYAQKSSLDKVNLPQ